MVKIIHASVVYPTIASIPDKRGQVIKVFGDYPISSAFYRGYVYGTSYLGLSIKALSDFEDAFALGHLLSLPHVTSFLYTGNKMHGVYTHGFATYRGSTRYLAQFELSNAKYIYAMNYDEEITDEDLEEAKEALIEYYELYVEKIRDRKENLHAAYRLAREDVAEAIISEDERLKEIYSKLFKPKAIEDPKKIKGKKAKSLKDIKELDGEGFYRGSILSEGFGRMVVKGEDYVALIDEDFVDTPISPDDVKSRRIIYVPHKEGFLAYYSPRGQKVVLYDLKTSEDLLEELEVEVKYVNQIYKISVHDGLLYLVVHKDGYLNIIYDLREEEEIFKEESKAPLRISPPFRYKDDVYVFYVPQGDDVLEMRSVDEIEEILGSSVGIYPPVVMKTFDSGREAVVYSSSDGNIGVLMPETGEVEFYKEIGLSMPDVGILEGKEALLAASPMRLAFYPVFEDHNEGRKILSEFSSRFRKRQ